MEPLSVAACATALFVIAAGTAPKLLDWQTDGLRVVAEKKNAELEFDLLEPPMLSAILTFFIVSCLFMA